MKNCNTLPALPITMNSREIAALVEKRHENVKRTIERLAERRVIQQPATGFLDETNNLGLPTKREVYVFSGEQGKRDSYVVVAKLAPQYIGKIVDVWGRTENSLNELLTALEAFDVPAELSDMFVYAIREVETGRIKLGIARDPHQRIQQLQTGNSQHLQLVAYRKACDRFSDEHALHAKAAQYHIRGEWFTAQALHHFNEGEVK